MSEFLKEGGKNPNADQWEKIGSESIDQAIDSFKNDALNDKLKTVSNEKNKELLGDAIFAAKAAVLKSYDKSPTDDGFNKDQENFEKNRITEKYGEYIPAEVATQGFYKEYVKLKKKFDKIGRAEEAESTMSVKQRGKSYKDRKKKGLIMTSEESDHLSKMNSMNTYQIEDYGREKHSEFTKIQAKKEAHPIKFMHLARKNQLSIPKDWDDPQYSLDTLKKINFVLSSLDDKI